jgi:hypothetical protein
MQIGAKGIEILFMTMVLKSLRKKHKFKNTPSHSSLCGNHQIDSIWNKGQTKYFMTIFKH